MRASRPDNATAIAEQAAGWFARRDAGQWSAGDQQRLEAWLAADIRHREAWERLTGLWAGLDGAPEAVTAPARRKVTQWQSARARRRRAAKGGTAAAIVLLGIFAATDPPVRLRADARTATGEQSLVRLADGSRVRLNTASAIRIAYSARGREVELLAGEAAFEVAPDPRRPFVVRARNGTSTALGTGYIVRRDGEQTHVTVTRHKVRVAVRRGDVETAGRVVRAGEGVSYDGDGLGEPSAVDAEAAGAWTRGRLIFRDRPLSEVVAELDRYHGGVIRILDDEVGARRVSGVFPIIDPVAAIDTIERSFGLRSVRLTDRVILIHG